MTICLASIYGIIHDQITFSISPEYYTKFKFVQLNFDEVLGASNIGVPPSKELILISPRIGVSIVGFLSTWWVGVIIGTILGLVALKFETGKDMYKAAFNAALWCIAITLVFSIVGYIVGRSYGGMTAPQSWYYPDNLLMIGDFVTAGMMHNFSYIGGGVGLLFSVFRLARKQVAIAN
jgi:hypothetical protein